jgi:hypothetical protein
MDSWRELVDQASLADLDSALEAALARAGELLGKATDFDPFAVFVNDEGKRILVAFDKSGSRAPEVDAILANLFTQLRAPEAHARCTAVVTNTRLSVERTDAIEIRLEHRNRVALLALLPYKKARFGPVIEFGELRVYAGEHEIFV